MIIFLDGTFGIGKTSTATGLIGINSHIQIMESDYYYKEKWCKNDDNVYKALFGGVRPQSNVFFLDYFKEQIVEKMKYKKIVLVVMALTESQSKAILFDRIRKKK